MIRGHSYSSLSGALLLAAVVGFAPGCTLVDEIFPGTFTFEQPVAEVTVVGKINVDRASGDSEGCPAGRALIWGMARNTGDVDVDDVFIEIDALDSGNNVIGTFRVHVFNGVITEILPTTTTTTTTEPDTGTPEAPVQIAGTSLTVDQSGTFEVCTDLAFGAVAGTAYRTDFTVIQVVQ